MRYVANSPETPGHPSPKRCELRILYARKNKTVHLRGRNRAKFLPNFWSRFPGTVNCTIWCGMRGHNFRVPTIRHSVLRFSRGTSMRVCVYGYDGGMPLRATNIFSHRFAGIYERARNTRWCANNIVGKYARGAHPRVARMDIYKTVSAWVSTQH